jgi:hypothetical protein
MSMYTFHMNMRALAITLLFFALPVCATAATVPAGFAPGALWLSSTAATSGDSLKMYTVIYDSTGSPVSGDVQFEVDSSHLQTVHFSLAAGQSQIVSADWTAVAGAHSFTATLKNVSGLSGELAQATTNTASIIVTPAAPSPITQYQNTVTNLYASSSPQVQTIVQNIANATEGARTAGEQYVANALASASKPQSSGQVLGAETFRSPAAAASAAPSIFNTLWRAVLTALLYVFRMQILFYIALAVVIYICFKILQGLSRYRN